MADKSIKNKKVLKKKKVDPKASSSLSPSTYEHEVMRQPELIKKDKKNK